jgi:TolA-binding protein
MNDSQDNKNLLLLLVINFGVSLVISLFAANKNGASDTIQLFLGLFGVGAVIAFILNHLLKGAGNAAGSLFLGSASAKKDDKAILKGMYDQANGFKLAGQFTLAEKVYRQITKEYPQETEAPYILANLLWIEMEKPKEAFRILRNLEKKIRLEKISFKYRTTLKQYLNDLKEELAPE